MTLTVDTAGMTLTVDTAGMTLTVDTAGAAFNSSSYKESLYFYR